MNVGGTRVPADRASPRVRQCRPGVSCSEPRTVNSGTGTAGTLDLRNLWNLLGSAFDLRPAVLERDRAVEDRPFRRAVFIHAEIPDALELDARRDRLRRREGLHLRVAYDLEGRGIQHRAVV